MQPEPGSYPEAAAVTAVMLRQWLAGLPELSPLDRRSLRDLLLQQLQSPSAATRAVSAGGLGRIGDGRAVPLLLRASADPNPLVRWHAVQALRSLSDGALVPPGTVAFVNDQGYEQWERDLVSEIARDLQAAQVSLRFKALEALAEINEPDAIPFLVGAMFDEHAPLRWEAGGVLVRIARDVPGLLDEATARLTALLSDPDRIARRSAAEVLGRLGARGAVSLLLPLLHDADAGVRWSACEALGMIGDKRAAVSLAGRLADDDAWVRRSAAEALINVGGHDAQSVLLRVVGDEDAIARQGIIKALAALGDEQALPALRKALQDVDAQVALAAMDGVARLRDRTSLPLLKRLRRGSLSDEAQASIRRIEKGDARN